MERAVHSSGIVRRRRKKNAAALGACTALLLGLGACTALLLGLCACSPRADEKSTGDDPSTGSTASQRGLRVAFGPDPVVVTQVAAPRMTLAAGGSPHPGVGPRFTATWTGSLEVLEAGRYRLRTTAPATISVAHRQIREEPVELAAGQHPLRLELDHDGAPLAFDLEWESEHFDWEPVPTTALSCTTGRPEVEEGRRLTRGLALLEELACVACHSMPIQGLEARSGPILTDVASRLRPDWIAHWLKAPHAFRRSAAMPGMLEGKEQRDIVRFLASLGSAPAPSPPQDEHHRARGAELFAQIGCVPCHGEEGLALDGLGSKYYPQALAAFLVDPAATSPGGRMPSMLLDANEALSLSAHLASSRRQDFEEVLGWTDANLVRGRSLVETSGCLACHTLQTEPPLTNRHVAPPLDGSTSADRGCLAETPPRGAPRFSLDETDRDALRSVFTALRELGPLNASPLHSASRRLEALRCSACHATDAMAAVAPPQERLPSLRGVGAKLKPDWLRAVLLEKRRVRPGLRTRMPHYPRAVVETLVHGLTALAGKTAEGAAPPWPNPTAREALEGEGLGYLGTHQDRGGLSCISCHDYGEHQPIADEKGPQLLSTHTRIRYDWFRRWMLAPARIASGTSMPSYFTQTPRQDATRTVAALWAALSRERSTPAPPGLDTLHDPRSRELQPVAIGEALILRFPLEGTSPATINVALPRQGKTPEVSCAFDASVCRVVLAWQGGFLDLSNSLTKRMHPAQLLGEVFFRSEAQPLRFGTPDSNPRARFRGYRLVDGFPEFRYELDDIEVRERIVPLWGADGFTREFHIAQGETPIWFVEEESDGVTLETTASKFEDGRLQLPGASERRFDVTIRRTGGAQ